MVAQWLPVAVVRLGEAGCGMRRKRTAGFAVFSVYIFSERYERRNRARREDVVLFTQHGTCSVAQQGRDEASEVEMTYLADMASVDAPWPGMSAWTQSAIVYRLLLSESKISEFDQWQSQAMSINGVMKWRYRDVGMGKVMRDEPGIPREMVSHGMSMAIHQSLIAPRVVSHVHQRSCSSAR